MLDFFLPLVQTSVIAMLFQQGRENVLKETGFSKVSTQHWYGMVKKSEGMPGLLEILSGKINICFPQMFWGGKKQLNFIDGEIWSLQGQRLLHRNRPGSGDFIVVTLICDSGSLFQNSLAY